MPYINVETGQRIADAARSYEGTKYGHQKRLPGVRLDCLGLVVCAAQEAGLKVKDRTDYSHQPVPVQLYEGIDGHCGQVSLSEARPGDVMMFRIDRHPQHFAVYLGSGRIVHSCSVNLKVVINDLGEFWTSKLIGVFRFLKQES